MFVNAVVLNILCLSTYVNADCLVDQDCWPSQDKWDQLSSTLNGTLHHIDPSKYDSQCKQHGTDPFGIEDQSPGVCFQYHNCRNLFCDPKQVSNLPQYTVEVFNADDVSKAIQFANQHDIQVSVKTTGHSFSGSNTQSNSIMIWTRSLPKYDTKTPNYVDSCGIDHGKVMRVGGGQTWLETYRAAGPDHIMVGGTCLSVGAAGVSGVQDLMMGRNPLVKTAWVELWLTA